MNETTQLKLIKSPQDFAYNLSAQPTAILYFTTPTCNVCKAVFPQLTELSSNYAFPLLKIDGSMHPDIAAQNNVFTVPTILVYHEGKEVLRESRFIDFNKIQRILDLLS